MKIKVGKVEIDFIGTTIRQHPKLLGMHDYQHNTSRFLESILELKQNNFSVGIAYFEPGLNKVLNVSAKGLCVSGHPVSLAQSGNVILVNTFTTIRPGIVLPSDVAHVSNFGFKGASRMQGYHKNGVIVPQSGIRDFNFLNLQKDVSKEDLLKILQEHIKLRGERAILIDLLKIINEENSKM